MGRLAKGLVRAGDLKSEGRGPQREPALSSDIPSPSHIMAHTPDAPVKMGRCDGASGTRPPHAAQRLLRMEDHLSAPEEEPRLSPASGAQCRDGARLTSSPGAGTWFQKERSGGSAGLPVAGGQ